MKLLFAFYLSLIFINVKANPSHISINKKDNWHIVTTSQEQEIQFAAQELQNYLNQIINYKIPILNNAEKANNIIIGLRENVPNQYKNNLPARHEGYDGYSISITRNPATIVIAGDNLQGTIYGVYDYLEHLGCRWFYPQQDPNDKEIIPHSDNISVEEKSWSVASPIKYRICNGTAWFFNMNYDDSKKQLDWAMKNRYNAMGWQAGASNQPKTILEQYQALDSAGVIAELKKRGMFIHGPAHSFDQFLLSDKYFIDHPEWFGMRNGKRSPQNFLGAQFCWSNAEARKEFIKNAEHFIVNAPQVHIFCTIPFDGGVPCECDECKKIGSSNLLMILTGELIEELKTSRPDVLVETIGGYGAVPDPPTDLSIISLEQRIIWAQWGRYHGIGYSDTAYNSDNLDNWKKAAKGGLSICNYYSDNFAEPWVMGPFTKAIKSDREYFLNNNIDALYVLFWSPGYWWNHSLNGYLAGRSYYDVSINPVDLVKDYALHYYGPQAGPLLSEYYTEWANDIDLSYQVRGGATNENRNTIQKEREKYINPAMSLTKDDPLYHYRVSKVEKLHTLTENLYEVYRLHDLIKNLRQKGEFDKAGDELKRAKLEADKTVTMFYELANLNEGLIDKGDVQGFTAPAITKWIDEEAKLIDAKNTGDAKKEKKPEGTETLPPQVTEQ